MARYIIAEARDADGKPCGWVVVELPDDHQDGDPLPAPRKDNRYYFDEKEAVDELHKRLYGRT